MRNYAYHLEGTNVPVELIDLVTRVEERYEILEEIVDIAKHERQLWLRLE